MTLDKLNITGLSDLEVNAARLKYGPNSLSFKKENGFIDAIKGLAKEPMVLLLLVTSGIYFISGKTGDGIFLASAVVLVAGISFFQDSRSRNAIEKLKDFSQPDCKVIRNGAVKEIKSDGIVIGDSLMVDEGSSIAADGKIIHSNDFSVNESILTGESLAVYKDLSVAEPFIFHGTTVSSGSAIITVTAIGNGTRLGKIGKSMESIVTEQTPLEGQINNFVKKMVIAGVIVFFIVWGINYFRSADVLDSLIKALTLAMSILPEEIPVAFTTFMALGAWRLMKMGIVVKQIKTVETLGSASVICTDKTGTITENKMGLAKLYTLREHLIGDAAGDLNRPEKELINLAMWASEPMPFDPMEIALHKAYAKAATVDERPDYQLIHEYPLNGHPPMMTHIFEGKSGRRIIAAKGAPEALIKVSNLYSIEKDHIETAIKQLAEAGYRVLAVGQAIFEGNDFPATQQQFKFTLKGLVAFYDPPKKNIATVLNGFYHAGIAIKVITGDNAETTRAIAGEIGLHGFEDGITGDELMKLSESVLGEKVESISIFSRMFPDAKLKIINALKANNEIVAMIGDGVNDGPALKAAHIGIAMGQKGTEIAKQAASLILLKDDLSKLVDAVAMGRRIYANLKKAIQYIISIHIPIVLTVFLPLALGWVYPNIFSPVHIIFLELIMGPTCSIIYENEPMEKNTMLQKPRPFSETFFNWKELMTSVIQGLVITAGTLLSYQYAVAKGADERLTRTMVFICLIAANILLTLVNRSFYYSLLTTIRYKNNLVLLIIGITVLVSVSLIYFNPFAKFFGFERLTIRELSLSVSFGFLSVIWFELFKRQKRFSAGKANNNKITS
ncbi:cation-translocating P-type ATPase [Mucilaginibacter glaciei]|uniref:Cation-translocating P-type ATPase n=1 Tax=Mucilaginibacter glaciei TaxID=2772109 RepID=A0A926S1N4_9SPHI|nr:cation-translocating P-type ATPase [Mucilaginibacter glaciei]MBD1392997.1 cation-translocating P-type ATPase [Mucilaginibacter glaciei]